MCASKTVLQIVKISGWVVQKHISYHKQNISVLILLTFVKVRLSKGKVYFYHETVNLTFILNFIGVKMTLNCEYDGVVGVILPMENKILPIVQLLLKLTKKHPFF